MGSRSWNASRLARRMSSSGKSQRLLLLLYCYQGGAEGTCPGHGHLEADSGAVLFFLELCPSIEAAIFLNFFF